MIQANLWTAVAAVPAAVGAILAAYFARGAKMHAAATNDATNHRHMRDVGDGPPPKLYDLMIDTASKVDAIERRAALLEAWNDRWTNLPPELADAERLVRRLERMNQSIDEVRAIAVRALRASDKP